MSWIFIEPEDVWFFRDTRSFGRGDDHLARCIFPPFPGTVAGAIRSRVIGETSSWDQIQFNQGQDKALFQRIGKPDDLGPVFRIRGPFLARLVNKQIVAYSPIPLDAFVIDKNKLQFGCLRPRKSKELDANWPDSNPLAFLWPPNSVRMDTVEDSYWLSSTAFRFYQSNGNFPAEPEENFFVQESRTGIGQNFDTGTAMDQMLYSAPFIRLQEKTGLLVWVADEVEFPKTGMLALGGESRAAHFSTYADENVRLMPAFHSENTQHLKVILQTPAYFTNGWCPKDNDWSRLGLPKGAKLQAVALGKPQIHNGWDIAHNTQKALRAFVPAGSVYFFEWEQKLTAPIEQSNVLLTESPLPGYYQALGLGQVVFGSWDWEE